MMPRSPMSASRTCAICRDTHTMRLRADGQTDRAVLCTHCPTPCQKCRLNGNGAYCAFTPCECACHYKPKLTRTVVVPHRRITQLSDFPVRGWSCTFPGCETWATLSENAQHHENQTGYAHRMERVFLDVDKSVKDKITARKFMQLVLKKYESKPMDFALSIGHWEDRPTSIGKDLPEFVAYMRLTVGELKEMLDYEEPSGEAIKCPKCKFTSGNCWSQCEGSCPMPMSPHFKEEERKKYGL